MTQVLHGPRIGKTGRLRVGCSAVIFDETRQKVLLTRRADNSLWCLPSGGMEPGETAAEACQREVLEETGLKVQVTHLIGIYTDPNRIVEYKDGRRVQIVALCFEAVIQDGELQLSDETTAYGYYTLPEIQQMEMLENHRERIEDAFTGQIPAYIR